MIECWSREQFITEGSVLSSDKSIAEEGVSLLRNLERKRTDLRIYPDLVRFFCSFAYAFV